MIFHLPIQHVCLANNPKLRVQMTAHHILSVVSYGGGLYFGRMSPGAAFSEGAAGCLKN